MTSRGRSAEQAHSRTSLVSCIDDIDPTEFAGDTSTVFDSLGNAVTVTDPSGNVTTNTFADSAFPTLQTSTTNALGETTTSSYDAAGNLALRT